MNRYSLATLIVDRLMPDLDDLQRQFAEPKTVPCCYIDDLLPETICRQLFQVFPPTHDMVLKKSLRENKYVAAQMNKYHPLLFPVPHYCCFACTGLPSSIDWLDA